MLEKVRSAPMPQSWEVESNVSPLSPEEILAPPRADDAVELDDAALRGVFGFNSRDRRSRPFNLLRSQVVKMTQANGWKIIGVTSATPGVGKTFTASNLAASMSRMPDMRTLLFDLDLRRGSVAQRFGLAPGPGINSYLSGEIDSLEAVAQNIAGGGLTIFPSFRTDDASDELLGGQRMKKLIEAMRALGEHCICLCDLPPAFANDDASIVLREIDAYLLVVEEGKTTARQVRDSIEVLKPAICMGTVLNRYRGGLSGDDYGFGYWSQRNYDAYYSE